MLQDNLFSAHRLDEVVAQENHTFVVGLTAWCCEDESAALLPRLEAVLLPNPRIRDTLPGQGGFVGG